MKNTGIAVTGRPNNIINTIESLFTDSHVTFYRLTAGKIAGTFKGAPVLLLTTTGRKTGKKRTKPLLYLMDNDQIVIVASRSGAPTDPSWWRNLQSNPHAEVQIKDTQLQIEAREATAAEREQLWPKLVALCSDYENYQQRTTRTIPVVILQKTS